METIMPTTMATTTPTTVVAVEAMDVAMDVVTAATNSKEVTKRRHRRTRMFPLPQVTRREKTREVPITGDSNKKGGIEKR